jgi:hypothetical protein
VLDEVTGSVGAAAIGRFGIDVSQLHRDLTSISLFGDYPVSDEKVAPRVALAPASGNGQGEGPRAPLIAALAVGEDGAGEWGHGLGQWMGTRSRRRRTSSELVSMCSTGQRAHCPAAMREPGAWSQPIDERTYRLDQDLFRLVA